MGKRSTRAFIAKQTVAITAEGKYTAPSGTVVSIEGSIAQAVRNTSLALPGPLAPIEFETTLRQARSLAATLFKVSNATTFAAARTLVHTHGADRVAALNFASAKNPGGGFLGGSQAQEESLARASALYACLERQPAYYQANRQSRSLLYTDHMIISPQVPVFRDDDDVLLEAPWEVTLITAPAPNAGAIKTNEPASVGEIESTFRRRIERVLSASASMNQTALVLGAWGCGVFRNDPSMVARLFGEQLLPGGPFADMFAAVAFAVLDPGGRTIRAFENVFGPADSSYQSKPLQPNEP